MKKLLRTTAAFVLLWTGHVFAAAPAPVCNSYVTAVASAKKNAPDLQVVEMTAPQRANIEKQYNAQRAGGPMHITHAYVLTRPHDPVALVVLVTGKDCVQAVADVPMEVLASLLGLDI